MRSVLAVLLLCLLVGCGPSITSGIVTNKVYEPTHTETDMVMMPMGESFIWIPQTTTYPDRWYITFEGQDERGRKHLRTVSVEQEVFDSYERGERIAFDQ